MKRRPRLTLRAALAVVAVAGLAIWWIHAPLARAEVYRKLGFTQRAWELALAMAASPAREELLARIMAEPVVDADGVERELWRVKREAVEIWKADPWWLALGPRGLPFALQELRFQELLAEPGSDQRDERLSAILGEGLMREDELFDARFVWQPGHLVCLGELFFLFEDSVDTRSPRWLVMGPDGLQIWRFIADWQTLVETRDAAGAVALIERALAAPASTAPSVWDALIDRHVTLPFPGPEFEEDVPREDALRRSVWELALDREPGPERDRLLDAIAQSKRMPVWAQGDQDLWVDAPLEDYREDPRAPSWVQYGRFGYRVRRLLDEFESWPLGHCSSGVEDPDAELWGLAGEGLLQAGAASADPASPLAAIRNEVLDRYRARGDPALSWAYLIVAEAACELHGDRFPGSMRSRVSQCCSWSWLAAQLHRGHVPSLTTPSPGFCLLCGECCVPAAGISVQPDGGLEWVGDSGVVEHAPPVPPGIRRRLSRILISASAPGSQAAPPPGMWTPGYPGRERIARLIRELPDWPWLACLAAREPKVQRAFEPMIKSTLPSNALLLQVLQFGTGGADDEAILVAQAARTFVERHLDRDDLDPGRRANMARLAAGIAVVAAGLELGGQSRLPGRDHILAFRRGHFFGLSRAASGCNFCRAGDAPAPGVEEHPDGSLSWVHPARGVVTLPPPPEWLLEQAETRR